MRLPSDAPAKVLISAESLVMPEIFYEEFTFSAQMGTLRLARANFESFCVFIREQKRKLRK
jgi:hypothetical protein